MPRFCPDVAFTLEAVEPASLPLTPTGLVLGRGELVVGLNVSGLLYMGGYTGRNMFGLRDEYHSLIDQLVDTLLTTGAKILLVAHEFGAEREEEACLAILESFGSRYPGRVFALGRPLSERELKWVIGRTDFFIGSRMHSCIAALSQYVPSVGLAYSDKFKGVFESAGVGDSIIDLREVEMRDVIERCLSALEGRADQRAQLLKTVPGIRQEVARTFGDLLLPASTTTLTPRTPREAGVENTSTLPLAQGR